MSSVRQSDSANSLFRFLRDPSPDRRMSGKKLSLASSFQPATVTPLNGLLALLPKAEYQEMTTSLEPVRFPKNGILYEAGAPMRRAIFVNSGIASVQAISDDGQRVEVATVGKCGFIGVALLLGVDTACYQVTAQTRIDAVKIDGLLLREWCNRSEKLQEVLLHYANLLETQIIQAVICRVAHDLKQRVARWLLHITDSLEADAFSVTHEQLSGALGKHRNRVGVVTGELERAKLIECGRGNIRIIERKALERVACECYRIVKEKSDWIGKASG